jgi:geranyl-CoA carboxylase alpha subunit
VLWSLPGEERSEPDTVRVDHALESGSAIAPFYDSMIAKVIARGPSRDEARERLAAALQATVALGVSTNKAFLSAVLRDAEFAAAGATTDFVARRFAVIEPAQPPPEAFALAAVLAAEASARAAGYAEWTSWSNDPARTMRTRLACGEVVADIAMSFLAGTYRIRALDVDCTLRLLRLDASRVQFALENAHRPPENCAAYARDGDRLFLAWAGASWRFDDAGRDPPGRQQEELTEGRLTAPMNARVVEVPVQAGDTVKAGAPLVVLEAMKMEQALSLRAAVKVKAVHVSPRAQVSPGQLLIEFDPI